MHLSTLTFSNTGWLWLCGAIVVGALFLLRWSYRATPMNGWHWMCAVLKAIGIITLALCLLEPLWTGQRVRPGANAFAIVADNSQGLQIKDIGANDSRGETLKKLLQLDGSDWQEQLEQHFELRRFVFDSGLHAVRDFGEMKFDGRASAIKTALHAVKERFTGRPLAGVLLLTDGNATDLQSAITLEGLPPIYPVTIGKPGAVRDVSVAQVTISQTAFEDAPVSAQAEVAVAGFRGEDVQARLTDPGGRKIEEQTLPVQGDNEKLTFRFRWRPEKQGLSFYRLQVGLKNAVSNAVPSVTAEATLLNNQRVLAIDRGSGPYRILYVSGRPNWEFKFLNRALQEDEQIQLVGMIRVALREPKFDFRGRAGETGNPLYRGFGNQSREEVERYDQPVLLRLNTRDELELRGGFPRVPEDLYGYHAVILDDIEAEFFASEQAVLLQKFVSERGGGFIMLGGMESLQQGKYLRTPIGDMLPVYLDRTDSSPNRGPWKMGLTREGWLQSWVRLKDNEKDEKLRLDNAPPFQVVNALREIKPGASVLASVADDKNKEYPALVTQRFGRGRSAVMTIGDFWRWGMKDADARKDMDKAWRQMVRWLVADVPNRIELAAEPSTEDANGSMQIQVRVRNEKFQPVDDAAVIIEVKPHLANAEGTATNVIRVRAEPSPSEPGLYQAAYVPHGTGGYQASAFVTNSVGAEVGRAVTGWSSDPAAEEFRSLQPNTAWLESLARQTGGEMVPASQLISFAKSLPHRQAPVMEAWTVPAWHTPLFFAFALACLAAEWGVRRWKGLP